ncbi:hypothetical protein BC332_22612 [Capsicum chinense]|nr:hypothetical protein BC332_22612 [Capsicum chinense]
MKKKSSVVQAQFGRCIMSLETKESTANAKVIRAKGINLHFSPREFVVVTGLNCVSNKDDFVFDEDLSNRLIEEYFGGAKYIQKRELFTAFSIKIWGKYNDEDSVKFANLYFIHEFLLSAVNIVVIPRLHFDLVESGHYSDYPWGSVAFEKLAKSLNKKLKLKGKFYMLHGMPLAIQIWLYECCPTVPRNVASRVDNQIPLLLNWKTNAPRPRYESLMESMIRHIQKNIQSPKKNHGDSSSSPVKKKLKQQHKGLDEQTPKRTPPPRATKKLSVGTLIFMSIQQKEKVASNRKDINRSASKKSISIQSPDSSLCSSGNEDDFVLQEMKSICGLVSTRCDEIMNVISEIKNKKLVDDNIGEAHISDSQFSFSNEVLRSINLDFIKSNLRVEDGSTDKECDAEKILNPVEFNMDNSKLDQQNQSPIHIHVALTEERKTEQNFSDSIKRSSRFKKSPFTMNFGSAVEGERKIFNQKHPFVSHPINDIEDTKHIDVCFYYLRKKSKYDPNTSYKYSTIDCNFMNIINSVLAVYRIDDASLNAGGKKYHLNEYISEFHMHATVPWHTVDHIFIPINVKAKHHWILAVISFNDRCIYIYDSLSSAGHDAGALAKVEKLAEGIDTTNDPNYKSYDKMNLFDVYVVEDLPQQPSGSLKEKNAQSDDEAPMRPPHEISLTEDSEVHEI